MPVSGAEARMAVRSKTTSAREGARAGIPPETKDEDGMLLLLTSEIRWEEKAWCSGDWRPRTDPGSKCCGQQICAMIASTVYIEGYGVPESRQLQSPQTRSYMSQEKGEGESEGERRQEKNRIIGKRLIIEAEVHMCSLTYKQGNMTRKKMCDHIKCYQKAETRASASCLMP